MTGARRKRVLVSATIAALAAAIGIGTYLGGSLGSLESDTVDARFAVHGSDGPPGDVVAVAVDDATLDELGLKWPFPRCLHARVLDRIAAGNPRAIVVDFQFTEPSDAVAPDGVSCDEKLVQAVDDAGNVVLGTTETDEHGGTQIFGGDDMLAMVGARAGITLVPYDDDGVLRHLPYEVQNLKSLGIVAAEIATGKTIAEPSPKSQWIDFAGPAGTVASYPYSQVLAGKVSPSAFAGKIVVVGPAATAFNDLHRTSAGDEPMPGVEVQANMVKTALDGFPLRGLWGGWNVLVIILLAAVPPLARLRFPTWQALLIGLGAGVLFVVAAQLVFEAGWIASMTYQLLALAISCIGILVAEVSHAYAHERRIRTARQTRVLISAWIAAVAIGITFAAYFGHVMRSLELKTVDARFGIRGSDGPPADLAVVEIDDATFGELREQWPFSRCRHARVIDRIAAGRPAAIAIDIQFTEPADDSDVASDGTTSCDDVLITAVKNAGNVVLSTTEVGDNGETGIFGGDEVLEEIGARPGNTIFPHDTDGVARHMLYEDSNLKTFGIVSAEVASGKTIRPPSADPQWVDFAGPPGTVRSYSYVDVLRGKIPPSVFHDKLVVLGPSATSLQDLHTTPTSGDTVMSGAELQANAAETALRNFPLRSLWFGWNFVLIVGFGLVAPLVSLRFKGWRGPAIAVGVGALFVVCAQLAFNHGRVVTLTYPLLALGLSAIGVLVAEYLLEAFERVRTHDTFSRFVPEAVVNQVLERTGGELRLGGELVDGTAMFTDLRGFTTFSEGLDAEEVIGLLNGYLGEISDAVLANGGTLVSYLGDGLMAVFGAPLPQEDHADRALAAAREMLEVRLPRYNETLLARGFERGFKMGIGLNSGPFMSGNVGSQRRLEYTAIGDTINTASRIEGMTKGTPYALYLADSTKEALTRPVDDLVYIDEMPVRGRTHPIKLWSLTADYVRKLDWESEGKSPPPAAPSPPETTEPGPERVPAGR
jgi:adenylate cyclase